MTNSRQTNVTLIIILLKLVSSNDFFRFFFFFIYLTIVLSLYKKSLCKSEMKEIYNARIH